MNPRLIVGLGALAYLASLSEHERQTVSQALETVRDVAWTMENVVQALTAPRYPALR